MSDQILVSRREAANALSISIRKLDYLIAAREIQVKRIGRRCLIPRRSLEEFARRDHLNYRKRTAEESIPAVEERTEPQSTLQAQSVGEVGS